MAGTTARLRQQITRWAFVALGALGGSAVIVRADDPALPTGTPDYSGVTVTNFFDRVPAREGNSSGDYLLPSLDPSAAVVVDPDGIGGRADDENPGTQEKPFRSLGRALRELKPGTVILLRRGIHPVYEPLKLDGAAGQKGSDLQPAIISSFPGETAVLWGAQPVQGWSRLGDTKIFTHDLAATPSPAVSLWVNDEQLPSIRRYLAARTAQPPFQDPNSHKPLPGDLPVSEAGTWALEGNRLFLRAPHDADPNVLRVELHALPAGAPATIQLVQSGWVIFHRLTFRKHNQTFVCYTSPSTVWRECVFDNCYHGINFYGGDRAERGIVDRCLFHRIGDGVKGTPLYLTAPMTIRHSLFVDVSPSISVTAYTSKDDQFSGLKVIGNTFLHGGACITSTGKGSLIQNNVALGSRFLSSAGSDAVVEGNVAVCDGKDLADNPHVPRRNIGFRMYGKNTRFVNNTLIGFAAGGNIYKPEDGHGAVEVHSNRFYGFTQYGLRIEDADLLRSDHNLFVPAAATNTIAVYLTPSQTNKVALTLAQWQREGHDQHSVWNPAATPAIPRVIREASR